MYCAHKYSLEALRYVIYGIAAVFAVYSLLLLFIGFVATGQAKKQVYSTNEITFNGKCCMNSATIFTYFMLLVWLFILCVLVIPTMFMKMTTGYCYSDGIIDENDAVDPNACINLTWYGLGNGGISSAICDDDLLNYCQQAEKSFVLFVVSFGSAGLATLGMINFLMCLAANGGHLRDGMKRQDYERKRNMEEQELFHLTMNKSTERLATTPYF
ncbi:neuronal membrane glycoprotein M6-a-like isoform X2 [Antedon mediterranea]|uniref:neuronal membrane glycoprotein M6-a-like isoform X2 n=1 Tax=Antedon mediterranea TaxID=105859 RepID=UPI003AF78DB3